MKVSIIIPTYGRPVVIRDCLNSLEKIKKEIPEPYEVIIVNNNKSELRRKTSALIRKFNLPVNEIKSKPLGSVKARNAGIKKAKGEILVFFDDDTLIQKNYFKQLLKHYRNKKVGGVGGSEVKKKQSLMHELFFGFKKTGDVTWSGEIISNFSKDVKKPLKVKHLHGSNFSIKKSLVKKIGLMDEEMEGHYRDETEYTYRVFKKGYDLIFEPEAWVIHTESGVGGSVSPDKKKSWAYWYHRNTSYFFFKHLYKGDNLKLIAYLFREFFMSLIRSVLYLNIYYLTKITAIKKGYDLYVKFLSKK